MSFQGHVENGMVITDHPLALPDGTPVRVVPIASPPTDFWRPVSLDDLAKEQGVSRSMSFEELVGGWPTEELDDAFEEAFTRWREHELDSGQ